MEHPEHRFFKDKEHTRVLRFLEVDIYIYLYISRSFVPGDGYIRIFTTYYLAPKTQRPQPSPVPPNRPGADALPDISDQMAEVPAVRFEGQDSGLAKVPGMS